MPTLEEELQALKSALSLLQSQHISDIKQLSERIDTLQRQMDEQKRRLSEQGQFVSQGFLRLEQQGKQQTEEIKAKFDASDHFAARTWGVVYEQDRNIREIKTDVGILKEQVNSLDGKFDRFEGQMVEVRQDINGLDGKFDRLEKLLLDRLPPSSK